jgi:hypothetical protein
VDNPTSSIPLPRFEYPENASFEEKFKIQFAAFQNSGAIVFSKLTFAEAWAALAAIQLACRHPSFDGPMRCLAVSYTRAIQNVICVTPELVEVAQKGWVPEFDIPPALFGTLNLERISTRKGIGARCQMIHGSIFGK